MLFVHLLKDLEPHPVINTTFLYSFEHLLNGTLALHRVLVLQHNLHKVAQSLLYVRLDKAEVLIALIL